MKTALRILAVAGKEIVETIRRPGALVSIVAGPFAILLAFGLGFVGQPPLRAELVIQPGSGLSTDVDMYRRLAGGAVDVRGLTADLAEARGLLAADAIDIVLVAPANLEGSLTAGEQGVLQVEFQSVSPYRAFIAQNVADQLTSAVNRQLIEASVRQATDAAAAAGRPLPPTSAALAAAPTRARLTNLAPSSPSIFAFYGIAVAALVVQHLAVTMSALSMSRDRRRGLIQLFRVSPVRSVELLFGKYLALGFVCALIATATLALLVGGLRVPFLGRPDVVAVTLGLLIAASLGVGILIALISDSERQVVQLALLILLASVFFGGLTFDLSQFNPTIRAGSEILPVTQATRLMQDLMLQGTSSDGWRFGALTSMGMLLFLLAAWRLRRVLASRP